jgi:hypothetical protein
MPMLNFLNIYKLVQKLLVGTHRQHGDLKPQFIFVESRPTKLLSQEER